jgi:PAS domain S-box-containing protein
MTIIHLTLAIILLGTLYIAKLLTELKKERKQNTRKSFMSCNTDKQSLIQNICFESPHEAIALFDNNGLFIVANKQFKQQFPASENPSEKAVIYDFFPEKLWLMLQDNLVACKLDEKQIQQEFSIENKHYHFSFSPIKQKGEDSRVFLFCKELANSVSHQPISLRRVSPDDAVWRTILKLTNPEALYSDWHNCFYRILPDICQALEADEIFLLDRHPATEVHLQIPGGPQLQKSNHDWIFKTPIWLNLLEKGNIIHNYSDHFDPEQQIILQQEEIKTLLLIPLIVDQKLVSVIGVSRTRHYKLFNQQQVNSLLFIANILSMAISNHNDRLERDRLVTVVEQSPDCIIVLNPRGIILYANKACEDVTGFSPAEVTGHSVKQLYIPSIRKKLWKELKAILATDKSWSGQFVNYRKNNTQYEEEMLLSPVYTKDGRVANRVLVKRDITEDKRLESIAEAANLMENIGFVFSSIRHELGNPINSIKVSLSVLESNLETYDTEAVIRFIHRSLSDIGRVEYLLKTLRNFSIFERPEVKATNMQSLLKKLIQLTEKDLAKQYVMLAIQQPDDSLIGMLDPRAFLQVLLNLTTNAVAALNGINDKIITISLKQKQDTQISFIFEDNGCGMDDETARNLFRPFFTTKAEGTGLGLVIVKKMLSKMDCSITASSEKGKGTRMEIIIPTV